MAWIARERSSRILRVQAPPLNTSKAANCTGAAPGIHAHEKRDAISLFNFIPAFGKFPAVQKSSGRATLDRAEAELSVPFHDFTYQLSSHPGEGAEMVFRRRCQRLGRTATYHPWRTGSL